MLSRYREPGLSRGILGRVLRLAPEAARRLGRRPLFMEVCGTHTSAFARGGLQELLKDFLELRSGPGCPVCVTSPAEIDLMTRLAGRLGTTVATFGDMVRVPGSGLSLEQARARGAAVQICRSPLEAVDYAAANPAQEVVFLGVGFETTAPAVALSIASARRRSVNNYSVYCTHKLIPPVLRRLLTSGELRLDGLLLPGHVCAVTGRRPYDFVAAESGVPAVVAGFEPVDLAGALHLLLEMAASGKPRVVNGYPRLVREEGNRRAQALTAAVFAPADAEWRGFGPVPLSGLQIRREYGDYDAAEKFALKPRLAAVTGRCRCGELLRGLITPPECPLFARECRPEQPAGPCMVSTEGACAAAYRYAAGRRPE